jgi:hypothetical protein
MISQAFFPAPPASTLLQAEARGVPAQSPAMQLNPHLKKMVNL